MTLLFSVPTGYHLRELVLPLKSHLEADPAIEHIDIVTPVADFREQIFAGFSDKFQLHNNPSNIDGHKQLFAQLKPDLVVTNTVGHDELDYPILKAAQELNINTLTFIASWDNVWKISRLIDSQKPIVLADRIIVWNQMMHDHMLELFPDLTQDRLHIIGAPRLDYFWHENKIPSQEKIYNLLGFEDTSRPLIHFTTTELYSFAYIVKTIRQAIDKKEIAENPYLYASVHPGGDIDNHIALKELGATVLYAFGRVSKPLHPSFAYVPTEQGIYNQIGVFKHADVLINQSSTTALESLIVGVPVINVKYGRPFDFWNWRHSSIYSDFQEHYIDLISDGATQVVKNKKQLIAATQKALKNKEQEESARQSTIKRMITTTDGTAGQKVLSVLREGHI